MSPNLILLGHIGRAHGIKGAFRIHPASGRAVQTAEALSNKPALFIAGVAHRVRSMRSEKDDLLVEIESVNDRNASEALRSSEVFVDRELLPPPDENELYLADLVGCAVVYEDGREIGIVTGSYDSGGNEVLIVDGKGRELLLPWVDVMIVEVDLPGRRIVYDPPPGLIDDDGEVAR